MFITSILSILASSCGIIHGILNNWTASAVWFVGAWILLAIGEAVKRLGGCHGRK